MAFGFFNSLKQGLKKTTAALGLAGLLSARLDEDLLDELEDRLLVADMGPAFVSELMERLRAEFKSKKIKQSSEVLPWLKAQLLAALKQGEKTTSSSSLPSIWFFLGVNGVGKTTSVGKLGKRLSNNGFSLLFAAGDTFRAAAAEQLQMWADRAGAQLISHREGGDPSAVVYDACEAAMHRKVDFLLIDTAGRLHNKKNLMAECAKMFRTVERHGAKIDEVFLVLDASTGQNAVQQAKLFAEVAPLTGIVLTKLDGSAKGGVVFQLVKEAGVRVRYVGVGEKIEDLLDFDEEAFVDAILAE